MSQIKKTRKVVKRKRKRIKPLPLILMALTILLVFCGAFFGIGYSNAQKAVAKESESLIFTIDPGTNGKQVLAQLEDEGIINNAFYAGLYAKFNGLTAFCAGTFELDKSLDLNTICLLYTSDAADE